MVAALLCCALLLPQQPTVTVAIDRRDLFVGDFIVLTITARTDGSTAADIVVPKVQGFETTDVRDRSSVRVDSGRAVRETVRRVTLRATAAGRITLGPIEVRQGSEIARSEPLAVVVRERAGAAGLPGRIRRLVERAPPPPLADQEVGVTLAISPDMAFVGQQVDVVTLAWIPREVRAELRTPPSIGGPAVTGGWVYHVYVPSAPTVARQVNGRSYDVYVLHDAVFPLKVGQIDIGPPNVSYAVPVSQSVLSREVRHEVQGAPATLMARAAASGSSASLALAVGRQLQWAVDLPGGELPVGEAREATIAVSGTGNVALWPAPQIRWPSGIRAYPDEPEVVVRTDSGVVAGSKVFRYLIVADSSGPHAVPALSYQYFDVDRASLVTLASAGSEITTPGAPQPRRARTAVPPLWGADRGPSLSERLDVPWRARWWLGLFAIGPVMALLVGLARMLARRQPRPQLLDAFAGTTLGERAREFRRVLEALIPEDALREGDRLADALRAAGVEAAVAQHATHVRDRLRQAVFGPGGAPDADELNAEVDEVLRVLMGQADRTHGGAVVAAAVLALLVGGVGAAAQAQQPDRLYEAGAYRAAQDSFAQRAASEPRVARHWFNLGAAQSALGAEGAARVAWVRAARLAPRDPTIAVWRHRETGTDALTRDLTWVAPVTPVETLLLALGVWTLGWLGISLGGRARRWAYAALVFAVLAGGVTAVVHQRYARPVAVLTAPTTLRAAPYGAAPAVVLLEPGSAVLVRRTRGAWVLIERGQTRGWLLAADLVRL